MPIKFSELTTKRLEESSKIIGLYSDNSSSTGLSNCVIDAEDFAKQTALNTLNSETVHIYGNEEIVGNKTFIGNVNINNTLSITQPMTTTSTINGVKPAASNSTSETLIPTIGWINDPATSTNVVHRSGTEAIAGTKTFTNIKFERSSEGFQTVSSKNLSITLGTHPSTDTGFQIYAQDKDNDGYNNRIGGLFTYYTKEGLCVTRISAYKPDKSGMYNASIGVIYPETGSPYTEAPNPPNGDSSTKIATTQWVNNHIISGVGCFPNYASHSGRSQNKTYTAATNGFLYVHIVRSNTSEGTLPITIGGYTFTLRSNDYGHVFVWYPIAKGTVYTIGAQTKLSTVELTWFPAL